jgi:hypothetical protein
LTRDLKSGPAADEPRALAIGEAEKRPGPSERWQGGHDASARL